jgi:hypothetical protein
MMKLGLSENYNINYVAKIVAIEHLVKHPAADNLFIANIQGHSIITNRRVEKKTLMVYFPLEVCIHPDFLSKNNLYKNRRLNADKKVSGFFEGNGRVKAIRLRGIPSEGFIISVDSLKVFDIHPDDCTLGKIFDTAGNIALCKKYLPPIPEVKKPSSGILENVYDSVLEKKNRKRIIEHQFRFHVETPYLNDNLHELHPDSLIQITSKIHGTSLVSSKLLCTKRLNTFQRFVNQIGADVSAVEYQEIWASRNVIKNPLINPFAPRDANKDIWTIAHNCLKHFLHNGMSIYAELTGYLPTGEYVQKDYDYGCDPFLPGKELYRPGIHFRMFIYRITNTNTVGDVSEYSAKQVQDWCKKHRMEAVPELYYGYAKDLYPDLPLHADWANAFFERLKADRNFRMERKDPLCRNRVPLEGLVVRIEDNSLKSYKLKTFKFYRRESLLLDRKIVSIEDMS